MRGGEGRGRGGDGEAKRGPSESQPVEAAEARKRSGGPSDSRFSANADDRRDMHISAIMRDKIKRDSNDLLRKKSA